MTDVQTMAVPVMQEQAKLEPEPQFAQVAEAPVAEAKAPVVEAEAEAPVVEAEAEAEAQVVEAEVEAPVVEAEVEAEAPVVEAEVEAEAKAEAPEVVEVAETSVADSVVKEKVDEPELEQPQAEPVRTPVSWARMVASLPEGGKDENKSSPSPAQENLDFLEPPPKPWKSPQPPPRRQGKPSKFPHGNTRPYRKNRNQMVADGAQRVRRPQTNKTPEQLEQEKQAYLARRQEAWDTCLGELCLPADYMEDQVSTLQYMIDPRTRQPLNCYSLTVDRAVWITSGEYKRRVRKGEDENRPKPVPDGLTVDEQVFSRDWFYRNRAFTRTLNDYYRSLGYRSRMQFRQRSNRWFLAIFFD